MYKQFSNLLVNPLEFKYSIHSNEWESSESGVMHSAELVSVSAFIVIILSPVICV